MYEERRVREWLAVEPSERSFDEGIALCADLQVRSYAELASRVLAALTPELSRPREFTAFQRERLEVLLELEQVRSLRPRHDALLNALARATLAGDNDMVDDVLPKLINDGMLSVHTFANLPRLRAAYEDALSLHYEKRAIVSKAQLAVIAFALTVASALWELWPSIKYYLGVRP